MPLTLKAGKAPVLLSRPVLLGERLSTYVSRETYQ
jgi:hypothetical protein